MLALIEPVQTVQHEYYGIPPKRMLQPLVYDDKNNAIFLESFSALILTCLVWIAMNVYKYIIDLRGRKMNLTDVNTNPYAGGTNSQF